MSCQLNYTVLVQNDRTGLSHPTLFTLVFNVKGCKLALEFFYYPITAAKK